MRLKDRVALITGAGSGIGRASALRFAEEGARVVVVDWNPQGGQETVATIRARRGEATFVHADISRDEDVRRAVDTTITTYGALHILYNNAGIQVFGTLPNTSEADWNKVMDVNLKGMYLACKYAIPHMVAQGGGSIICTSSALGLVGDPDLPAYGQSRGPGPRPAGHPGQRHLPRRRGDAYPGRVL
jgi:meso-butanediol dehydrogenase/(S,S)-butanediol dehydrogenase/diacetyl reductase